jgi:hypothetical protein
VKETCERWGVQWYSVNRLDGITRRLIWGGGLPLLFRTRKDARDYVAERYGYIRHRPDLRAEPHGWRVPRAVRVEVTLRALPDQETKR